jgi:hypothetical protein
MMTELIDGSLPSLTDIFCVQSAILECQNIYKPLHLKKQLMQSDKLEVQLRPSLLASQDTVIALLFYRRVCPSQCTGVKFYTNTSAPIHATEEITQERVCLRWLRPGALSYPPCLLN